MFPFTIYYIPHTRDWERKMYCRFFHYRQVNRELGKELSEFRRFLAHKSREILVSLFGTFFSLVLAKLVPLLWQQKWLFFARSSVHLRHLNKGWVTRGFFSYPQHCHKRHSCLRLISCHPFVSCRIHLAFAFVICHLATSISCSPINCHIHISSHIHSRAATISCHIHQLSFPSGVSSVSCYLHELPHPSAVTFMNCHIISCHIHELPHPSAVTFMNCHIISCHIHELPHPLPLTFMSCHIHQQSFAVVGHQLAPCMSIEQVMH
jgi:hypothetical protein